jgi:hypothetical protein
MLQPDSVPEPASSSFNFMFRSILARTC